MDDVCQLMGSYRPFFVEDDVHPLTNIIVLIFFYWGRCTSIMESYRLYFFVEDNVHPLRNLIVPLFFAEDNVHPLRNLIVLIFIEDHSILLKCWIILLK